LNFDLTPTQQELYNEVVRFARAQLRVGVAERDCERTFSRELWRLCGALGLHGLAVPAALGGRGADPLTTAVAFDALGFGCPDSGLAFSVGAHLATAAIPLWKYGTAEQQARYLGRLCNGSLIGIGALTEPGAGSDAFSMASQANCDGTGFILNGTKRYISNAPVADLVVLYAVTDRTQGFMGGVTAFLLQAGSPGLHVSQVLEPMGLRTVPLGEIVMSDVRVTADDVLGGIGGGATVFGTAMDWERVVLSASHVGTMQRLLEGSIQHARTRMQFGQSIGKFQAVAHRLVDQQMACEAARLLVYRAASHLERSKTVAREAAMAKLFTSEAYVETALTAIRTHGASGYMTGAEPERAVRDAVGSTIYSGTSDIQRNIIARWLGLL
jgi:alkylation response protein AidB-like acyl-CoA dehydrogenase